MSRSRARDAPAEGTEPSGIESPEPQLVKGHSTDLPSTEFITGAPEIGEAAVLPPAAQASDSEPVSAVSASASNGAARASEVGAEIAVTEILGRPAERDMDAPTQATLSGNGNSSGLFATAGPQPQPGEPRRTLHLSLSHNNVQAMEIPPPDRRVADMADPSGVRPVGDRQQAVTPQPARVHPAPNSAVNNGGGAGSMVEPLKGRDGGTFIDRALRERVDGDISAFLAAFDAALADDTIESRAGLREATDRLLRAGARTRIELERLEARVPLSARDTTGYSAPSWRPR